MSDSRADRPTGETNSAALERFTCHGCGYTSVDPYTVAVISDIEGVCPVCAGDIGPENFTYEETPS